MKVIEGGRVPVKAWIDDVELEEQARQQLLNAASLPFVFKHIAVMPDVHWGMGATVGSVIPTVDAIVPAAVGVDIGCGMMAVRTSLKASQLPDSLSALRSEIERAVPVGGPGEHGSWKEVGREGLPAAVVSEWGQFADRYQTLIGAHPKIGRGMTVEQLGTLGTGNHFIEICLDEDGAVWAMLHSGSRGMGNRIGMYFIDRAKEEMRRWHIGLADPDLAYLPQSSTYFGDYYRGLTLAQEYARVNRELMMARVIEALRTIGAPFELLATINCHHNYVAKEHHFGADVWITRKGAVRARQGDMGIIPGSMGASSFIVRGKGNPQSFDSCSHGAGRRMSRGAARKRFTVEDHIAATVGVECRKDAEVIDETPGAYKSIDAVMAAQSDLVEIVHRLKQVVCVKG